MALLAERATHALMLDRSLSLGMTDDIEIAMD